MRIIHKKPEEYNKILKQLDYSSFNKKEKVICS